MSLWPCRGGWHSWRFLNMRNVHPSEDPHGLWMCDLTERCTRCRAVRIREDVRVPGAEPH